MLVRAKIVGLAFLAATMTAAAAPPGLVRVPMVCSRGSGDAEFFTTVLAPPTVPHSSRYVVRIEGAPTKKIASFGLRYIHDISINYTLPDGATYVPGSVRVIPGTGTPNVASGARTAQTERLVRLTMPGRVDSGSSYTPPDVEFQLEASAPPGAKLALSFSGYEVMANAIIVGDVRATCESVPRNYTIATTLVTEGTP